MGDVSHYCCCTHYPCFAVQHKNSESEKANIPHGIRKDIRLQDTRIHIAEIKYEPLCDVFGSEILYYRRVRIANFAYVSQAHGKM